ncbi:hypothetical protein [Rubrivivax gelatinosus]|uniref:hypothetical protein n=1 Tax=Rubrivivax gelatinosus TaxID=28068 RepID=UPI0002F358E8|nr:hypothetical protein [Rubrivivax gelatinosus]MBG6081102.1 hypothetical protein [Rubrivivax gelatinosus]
MKTLLALMLGALAANHFYKSRQRRRGATALADGMSRSTSTGIGAPDSGAASPGTAEGLQQSQAGREDLDTPRPGLPDFARGA